MVKLKNILFLFTIFLCLNFTLGGCAPSEKAKTQPISSLEKKTAKPNNGSEEASVLNTKTIHSLDGASLIGELPDGRLVTLTNSDEKAKINSIYIVDKSGNNRMKLMDSTDNKLIYTVALADPWVVYAQATDDMICADWEIKAINIETKKIIDIDYGKVRPSQLNMEGVATLMGPMLSSSGTKIAWTTFELDETNHGIAVVRSYDLSSNKSVLIDQNGQPLEEFGHPKIDGNLVVYDKGHIVQGIGREGTVYIKNLSTNESQEIESGMGVCEPCIKYPYVAWNSGNRIKIYNIETKTITKISGNSVGWTPSINAQYVSWLGNDQAAAAVCLYKLPSGPAFKVFAGRTVLGGTLSGNLLSWPKKAAGPLVTEYIDLTE